MYPSYDPVPVPRRRRRSRVTASAVQRLMRGDRMRLLPMLCRAAALLAILLGGVSLVYFNRDRIGVDWQALSLRKAEEEPPPLPIAQNSPATNAEDMVAAVDSAPKAQEGSIASVTGKVAEAAAVGVSVETSSVQTVLHPAAPPEASGMATNAVASSQGTDSFAADVPETDERAKPVHRLRVVLTDGKKIVRRPGGRIEVPRVFSSIGAGVKPFWVYGPRPEIEAEKERKARAEWHALIQKAQKAD